MSSFTTHNVSTPHFDFSANLYNCGDNPLAFAQEFNVFVFNGTRLQNGDIYGPVAIGGDLRIERSVTIASHSAGTFFVGNDEYPTALLVDGKLLYGSGNGININRQGFLKLGNDKGTNIHDMQNGNPVNTRINSGNFDSKPSINLQVHQPAAAIDQKDIIEFNRVSVEAKKIAKDLSNLTPNNAFNVSGSSATLQLLSNQVNVINIKGEDLNNISLVDFRNKPSVNNPLIINVDVTGSFQWKPASFNGVGEAEAAYILYNFEKPSSIEIVRSTTSLGSILAPKVNFTQNASGRIVGQVVAKTFAITSGTIAYQPFAGLFPTEDCDGDNSDNGNDDNGNGNNDDNGGTTTDTGNGNEGCTSYTPIDLPFSFDGKGEYCWEVSGTVEHINSWGLKLLEINGFNYTNKYANTLIEKVDGKYRIRYISEYDWGHFEISGENDPKPEPTGCETYSRIPMPYKFEGKGEYCWEVCGKVEYVNSWNLELLEINGVDYTNKHAFEMPATNEGKYQIRFISKYDWGHFEIDGEEECIDEACEQIAMPFKFEGVGEYCWEACGAVKFINSWELELLEINGVDYTNRWSDNMPEKIDGKYKIRYISRFDWGHFEIIGEDSNDCSSNEEPVTFEEMKAVGLDEGGDNWAASWGDYDGDGNVDLIVTTYDETKPNKLYHNNGDGTFTKVENGQIATDIASSLAASWADYDNDRDLDLIIANHVGKPNFLYRNEGGSNFTRIFNDPIVTDKGYAHGISWADYDNDGHLDLFEASFFSTQFNGLFHNNGDGTFEKYETNAIGKEASFSTSGVWADYNNDGLIDLFVTNTRGEDNSLYQNKGNGNFIKINAGTIVNDGGVSVGASWGDYDNDGDLDLFVANASDDNNFLYRNEGNGQFNKITEGIIVNDGGHSHGSAWADYDNDGWLDLFVANDQGQDNFLYKNNGDGTFTKVENAATKAGGNSFGVAWADVDNDGGLDLFVTNREDEKNFVYKNKGAANRSRSCIRLIGTNSNRSAIGAKIYVKAKIYGEDITQLREISSQTGGGIGGQNELKATFGLGDAPIIDSIIIHWPSGYKQYIANQMIDECLVITEESGAKVSGVVYHDENQNCQQDENEKGVPNQQIILTPGNHIVISDENGAYEAFVPVDEYDLIVQPQENWSLSCQSSQSAQSVRARQIGDTYNGFDVGLKTSCNTPDLNIETAVTAHRIGFRNLIAINCINESVVDAKDVIIKMALDEYCIPITSTIPWTAQEGNVLIWKFDQLAAGEKSTIYVTDSVDANTPIGQELTLDTKIGSAANECDMSDNEFRLTGLAIGALDPNDILVSPEGAVKKDELLSYKIRFQNVGNIPVATVRVECELPKELDQYTLELGIGSHPFRFEQRGDLMHWEFPNINLPDSVNNEPESHGFVTFRIRPKVNLAVGTEIENSAEIFFDNMSSIKTNVVVNTIQPEVSTTNYAGKLLTYPNPSYGNVTLQIIPSDWRNQVTMHSLVIYNAQGVVIRSFPNVREHFKEIDLSHLPTGVYFAKALDLQGEEYGGKFLISHE